MAGSILLAGLLLKLGGFGLMRCLWLIERKRSFLESFIIVVGLWGGLMRRFVCLTQRDLKAMVAYSSISHMSLCVCGILRYYYVGWSGTVCLMFAHGLCSPIIFSLIAECYKWSSSRRVVLNKGLLISFPVFCIF